MKHSFTVRRRGSRYFFSVHVCHSKAQMFKLVEEHMVEAGKKKPARNYEAICCCYERIRVKDEKRMPDIGQIFFHKERLGAGIVAHEMLHAALHHERLIDKNEHAVLTSNIGEAEERVARTLTHMVRKFTNEAYGRGIYKSK